MWMEREVSGVIHLDLLAILVSFCVGIVILEVCFIIMQVFLADALIPSGAQFRRWDILWFRLERDLYAKGDKQGRLRLKTAKFVFAPHLFLDLSKVSKKRLKIMDLVSTGISFILASIMLLLSFMKWRSLSDGFFRSVVWGVCAGFFGFSVMLIFMVVKANIVKNTFHAFLQEKLLDREHTGSYQGIDLPPLSEVMYMNPTEPEKLMYLDMRYRKCSFENDLFGISTCALEMGLLNDMKLAPSGRFSKNSNLMDYYAFRQKDPVKAREYYEKSEKEIEEDMDCNGRRKLAYFSYFVLKDIEKAEKCIEQGFEALTVEDPLFGEEERNYERQMLTYLKDLIEKETAEITH